MQNYSFLETRLTKQKINLRESAISAPTYDLLGVNMSVVDISSTVHRLLEAVSENRCGYVCVTGVHGVIEALDDLRLQSILNNAFLCVPDGMPTVWMGHLRGHKTMRRVYGPDLMLAIMEATQEMNVRHFFYGGSSGVAEELKANLKKQFSGIQIVGTYSPPFRPLDTNEIVHLQNLISTSRPHIVWVGLSTPKQELFMAEFLPQLDTCLMIGVGAAFDFHTGRVRQAPLWIRQNGLEWLFRLVQEPKRLWRRYLKIVPRFIWLVFKDRIKKNP